MSNEQMRAIEQSSIYNSNIDDHVESENEVNELIEELFKN